MKICKEMVKLREGLDKRNIVWIDKSDICPKEYIKMMKSKGFTEEESDFTMYRTHFTYKDHFYSVIFGYGSYGGVDAIDPSQNNCLLEMMIDDNYSKGWLTAEDVLNIVDKA